jgi:hypothetical protein
VIFDEGTTLGMVRLYVADVISKLSQLFQEMRAKGNPGEADQGLNSEYSQSAKNMLNSLFDVK